jgi:hypothetical protein
MARYRYRRRSRMSGKEGIVAVAVGVALAGVVGHSAVPVLTSAGALAADIPGGSAYTPHTWAVALLTATHLPLTACNVAAVTDWENAEGGNWQNSATANPLNTTMPEPGSHSINSAAVQAYPSWPVGFTATVATLNNGNYPGILGALRAGDNAGAVAAAVGASPWGTGNFPAAC